MPRGFLVKRYPNQLTTDSSPTSQSVEHSTCVHHLTTRPLIYRYSDEDRSDSSSSEPEASCVPSIPSPHAINQSSHPLASLSISTPLLSYGNQYSKTECPQEVPLALTKSSFPSDRKTPIEDESPSALDLRCPSFIFHFPDRMPASAPSAYQRNISALISRSPNKPNTSLSTSKKRHSIESQKSLKRHKVIRKLNFDEHKSSPVSGTFIRDSDSEDDFTNQSSCVRRSGDIDPSLNVVVITEEARAEIEKIENKIGDYICALCKEKYLDAFGLAQHRCTRIVHVEYRCPECDKVFNCPANLASHRRWHKPKTVSTNGTDSSNKKSKVSVVGTATIHTEANSASNCSDETNSSVETTTTGNQSQESTDGQYECQHCNKKFRRNAYLKKHLFSLHNIDIENKSTESESKKFEIVLKRKKSFDFTNGIENEGKEGRDGKDGKEFVKSDFKYKCLICSLAFNNEISMQLHRQSVHPNDSFSCRFCQSILFSESELSLHINEYHSNKDNPSVLKISQSLIKSELN